MEEAIWVHLVTGVDSQQGKGTLDLLLEASGVVQLVLILLVLASIVCWYIMNYKSMLLV